MVVMLVIVTIAMMLLYRLHDSRIGRAWMAIREDELAASANGINTVVTKLLAFAIGATTSGFAGVFNASKLTIVSPDQFLFTVSFTVLAMVIIGGMGNIWAAAAGAFIVYILQVVLLRQLSTITEGLRDLGFPVINFGPINLDIAKINFVDYQYLLFGLALVLMMLKRPEGSSRVAPGRRSSTSRRRSARRTPRSWAPSARHRDDRADRLRNRQRDHRGRDRGDRRRHRGRIPGGSRARGGRGPW